ncbi:MAG: TylF/MycF/NovP-related O-methyltransferase [Patescibacteria group bacterium]
MKKKTQVCKKSLIVLLLKKILFFIKAILPPKWYDAFYKFTFKIYKSLIRFCYLRFYIYYYLKGDKKNLKKTKIIYRVMPYSLVGEKGLAQTYDLVEKVVDNNLEGGLVECGVAQGGCAALMASLIFEKNNQTRKLWLCDSYEGLPDPTKEDFDQKMCSTGTHTQPMDKGFCLGTLEQVKQLMLETFNFPKDKIIFVKGWFKDTLPLKNKEIGKIAILRIDADWYDSTKECLEYLYDQVVAKGFIIIDDYGTCFGCQKAVDEFLASRGLTVEIKFDGRGGCYWIKS